MDSKFWRRVAVTFAGNAIMGPGVALIKLSSMGNDPYNAMGIAIGETVKVDFAIAILALNCFLFLLELAFGRKLIGVGTLVNWLMVGPLASACEKAALAFWLAPDGFFPRLLLMLAGVIVLSLACALYQTANVGVAPYDSLSMILDERTRFPYWACRAFTDIICVIITFALGGLLGLGTLVCAVGLGPFIAFFSRWVAKPLCEAGEK